MIDQIGWYFTVPDLSMPGLELPVLVAASGFWHLIRDDTVLIIKPGLPTRDSRQIPICRTGHWMCSACLLTRRCFIMRL